MRQEIDPVAIAMFESDPEHAPEHLQYHFTGVRKPVLVGEKILHEVALKHRFKVEDLKSKGCKRALIKARQEAMYRLREEGKFSFPQIGRMVGRDHSTVIHGYQMHKSRHLSPPPERPQ